MTNDNIKSFPSKYPGCCTHCGREWSQGTTIAYIKDRMGYFCSERCAEDYGQTKISDAPTVEPTREEAIKAMHEENIKAQEHLTSALRALTVAIGKRADTENERNKILLEQLRGGSG